MTIAVLSWASRKTLRNSLESYRNYGLDVMDPEKIIFFQEITNEDRDIAAEFGYEAHGVPINIGIANGYKSLVELATGDLFLFLENDWELIEDPKKTIQKASDILRNDAADVVRLRHRERPGAPLWSRVYERREMDRPEYLLDSIHWTNPEIFAPIHWDDDFFWTTAQFANWTNNPTLFRTQWLRDEIVPLIEGDIEIHLQPWWKEQNYNVIQHEVGLFTHNRLDR